MQGFVCDHARPILGTRVMATGMRIVQELIVDLHRKRSFKAILRVFRIRIHLDLVVVCPGKPVAVLVAVLLHVARIESELKTLEMQADALAAGGASAREIGEHHEKTANKAQERFEVQKQILDLEFGAKLGK